MTTTPVTLTKILQLTSTLITNSLSCRDKKLTDTGINQLSSAIQLLTPLLTGDAALPASNLQAIFQDQALPESAASKTIEIEQATLANAKRLDSESTTHLSAKDLLSASTLKAIYRGMKNEKINLVKNYIQLLLTLCQTQTNLKTTIKSLLNETPRFITRIALLGDKTLLENYITLLKRSGFSFDDIFVFTNKKFKLSKDTPEAAALTILKQYHPDKLDSIKVLIPYSSPFTLNEFLALDINQPKKNSPDSSDVKLANLYLALPSLYIYFTKNLNDIDLPKSKRILAAPEGKTCWHEHIADNKNEKKTKRFVDFKELVAILIGTATSKTDGKSNLADFIAGGESFKASGIFTSIRSQEYYTYRSNLLQALNKPALASDVLSYFTRFFNETHHIIRQDASKKQDEQTRINFICDLIVNLGFDIEILLRYILQAASLKNPSIAILQTAIDQLTKLIADDTIPQISISNLLAQLEKSALSKRLIRTNNTALMSAYSNLLQACTETLTNPVALFQTARLAETTSRGQTPTSADEASGSADIDHHDQLLKTTAKAYFKAAIRGYIPAQLKLANFFLHGDNESGADIDAALQWLHLAAEQGSQSAKYQIKAIDATRQIAPATPIRTDDSPMRFPAAAPKIPTYMDEQHFEHPDLLFLQANGYHDDGNLDQAIAFYKKAADQHQIEAAYQLANIFLSDTPANYDAAKMYYSIAAAQGHPDALFQLGEINYFDAQTYERSSSDAKAIQAEYKKAERHYRLAMQQGHSAATAKLIAIYTKTGNMAEQQSATERLATTAGSTDAYLAGQTVDSANKGYSTALCKLANQASIKGDTSSAIESYKKAADIDSPEAHFQLGLIKYNDPKAAALDSTPTYTHFSTAAELGHVHAKLYCINMLLKNDNPSVKNRSEKIALAYEYYTQLPIDINLDVELIPNYLKAQAALYFAEYHFYKDTAINSYENALYYFSVAAMAGNTTAMFYAGKLLETDPAQLDKAKNYYQMASSYGHIQAMVALDRLSEGTPTQHYSDTQNIQRQILNDEKIVSDPNEVQSIGRLPILSPALSLCDQTATPSPPRTPIRRRSVSNYSAASSSSSYFHTPGEVVTSKRYSYIDICALLKEQLKHSKRPMLIPNEPIILNTDEDNLKKILTNLQSEISPHTIILAPLSVTMPADRNKYIGALFQFDDAYNLQQVDIIDTLDTSNETKTQLEQQIMASCKIAPTIKHVKYATQTSDTQGDDDVLTIANLTKIFSLVEKGQDTAALKSKLLSAKKVEAIRQHYDRQTAGSATTPSKTP